MKTKLKNQMDGFTDQVCAQKPRNMTYGMWSILQTGDVCVPINK